MKKTFSGYLCGAERILLAPAPATFQLTLQFSARQCPTLYLPTDNQRQVPVKLIVNAARHHLQLQSKSLQQTWLLFPSLHPKLKVTVEPTGFSWQYGWQNHQVALKRLASQRLVILASQQPLDYHLTIMS